MSRNGVQTNQMDNYNYDAAGNLLSDNINNYVYDAEGRVSSVNGSVQYVYDAEGRRVAKAAVNGGAATLTEQYLLGLGGEQVSVLDGQGNWKLTNVYASGKLLATYNPAGLHFHFTDWLGTRRVQASATGTLEETCQSYAFGDSLNCSGTDATPLHFTSKQRDAESGLDYFGARYMSSNTQRWMSPDPLNPVHSSQSVLDQFLLDPQDWNKYSYGLNNPVRYKDASGYFTAKDHQAIEMAALRNLGYSNRAAARAARADVAMDDPHNMASGVPFLHHFVETSQNPQHGEQSDRSNIETAKSEAGQ